MPVLLQDVPAVAATAVRAPDVCARVLAQLARVHLALVHVILQRVGRLLSRSDGEGLPGEQAV